MKRINISFWNDKEIEDLAKNYNKATSKSKKFSGIPFSVIGNIDDMKVLYDRKAATKCKWVLRYLKLLQEFLQQVDCDLLEDVYIRLTENAYEKDSFEECLHKLEYSGFLVRGNNIVSSWESYLEYIIDQKDYYRMNTDMGNLIKPLSDLLRIDELTYFTYYLTYNKHFDKSIECCKQLVKLLPREKKHPLKHVVYHNWGVGLLSLGEQYNNPENQYKEACNKFELAIQYKEDFPQAYFHWGTALSLLAVLSKNNKEKLYNDACDKLELANKIKNDYPQASITLGVVLSNFSNLKENNDELEYILRLYLKGFMLSILQGDLKLAYGADKQICRIDNDLSKSYKLTVSIFSIALNVISGYKLSDSEIIDLQGFKGLSKANDIIIDAILNNKLPDDIDNPDEELVLETAIFLAKKITNSYEKK